MLVKGDKIKLINPMGVFDNIGEICEVTDIANDTVSFKFGEIHLGCISIDEFPRYFEKYEEPKKVVDMKHIEKIIDDSETIIQTVFDKCTIVSCRLPNGFVIVASSSCANPEDYNENLGVELCLNCIKNKVLEMETYMKTNVAHNEFKNETID